MIKSRPPARLRQSWEARCRLVSLMLSGQSAQAAAAACGMSRSTAYQLLRRYQSGGWGALRDRPPVAKHCPHRLSPEAEAQIVALSRQTAPHVVPDAPGTIRTCGLCCVGAFPRLVGSVRRSCQRCAIPGRAAVRAGVGVPCGR